MRFEWNKMQFRALKLVMVFIIAVRTFGAFKYEAVFMLIIDGEKMFFLDITLPYGLHELCLR
jgi:hypothetical protein